MPVNDDVNGPCATVYITFRDWDIENCDRQRDFCPKQFFKHLISKQ